MQDEIEERPIEGRFVDVPWDAMDANTLSALVEEFVSREGTDYGDTALSLEEKAQQVIGGLQNQQYVILFDQGMQSCHIAHKKIWLESVGI